MTEADDLLRSGDIDGARRALVDIVRSNPGDVPTRMFLFSLLAVAGEWEKAKAQLTALAQLSPEAQMLAVVYTQALDAERERERVFAGEALAPIHGDVGDWAQGVAKALTLAAQGKGAAAESARLAAFDAAPDTPGEIDGTRFDWIADADPRFGPTIEAIIGGRYGLLPVAVIERLESEGPRDLRDIVWYPVEITLKAGPRIAALLPARYPGIAEDSSERLGRATSWDDGGRGSGQRLLALSTDEDRGLLSVRAIRFD